MILCATYVQHSCHEIINSLVILCHLSHVTIVIILVVLLFVDPS